MKKNENNKIEEMPPDREIRDCEHRDAPMATIERSRSEATAAISALGPAENNGKTNQREDATPPVENAKTDNRDPLEPFPEQPPSEMTAATPGLKPTETNKDTVKTSVPHEEHPEVEILEITGEDPPTPLERQSRSARDDYELMLSEIMEEFQSIGRCPPFIVVDHDWDQTSRAMLAFKKSRGAFEAHSKYRRVPAAKRDAFLEDPLYPEVAYLFREFKHQVRCYYEAPNRGYLQRAILLSHEIVEHVGVITKQRRWIAQDQARAISEERKTKGALQNREIREGRTQQRLHSDGKESRLVSYARKSAVRR